MGRIGMEWSDEIYVYIYLIRMTCLSCGQYTISDILNYSFLLFLNAWGE